MNKITKGLMMQKKLGIVFKKNLIFIQVYYLASKF